MLVQNRRQARVSSRGGCATDFLGESLPLAVLPLPDLQNTDDGGTQQVRSL